MTNPAPAVHCPFCMGLNVEPVGELWRCRDCKKDFREATVSTPSPKEPKEKPA